MSLEFKIDIISPDQSIYSNKTEEVILPCFEGQITVLKDHIPLITFLRPGLIEIGKAEKFYTEDGTVEFANNKLLIVTSTAKNIKEIDKDSIVSKINDTEKELTNQKATDKEKYFLSYKIEALKNIS